MNAPVFPEVLLRRPSQEAELPLAMEGVRRYVWDGRFGSMLIEVIGEDVFVNESRVERMSVPPAAD